MTGTQHGEALPGRQATHLLESLLLTDCKSAKAKQHGPGSRVHMTRRGNGHHNKGNARLHVDGFKQPELPIGEGVSPLHHH